MRSAGGPSPDGSTVVLAAGRSDSSRLHVRRLDSFETRTLPSTEGGDPPCFAPEGRWVAWLSDASGRREVVVRRSPDGPDVPVSHDGSLEPAWEPGGPEIWFRDIAGTKMMVAPFQPREPPRVGAPQVLSSGRYGTCASRCGSYNIKPDGGTFVMLRVP